MESERKTRRASSVRFTIGALASAVGAVALLPQATQAATRTENFDIAPAHWIGVDNTGGGGNTFGFSSGNLTGQTSPGGEAKGTFARSNDKGMYGDNTIGILNQDSFIHADGEFWFGNGSTADTDGFLGHQNSNWLFDGININHCGMGIFESPPSSFRFAALIYTDQGGERVGSRVVVPEGQYKFSYDWNPTTNTLTANILTTAGAPVASSSVTTADTFELDSFGMGSGFNGSTDVTKTYDWAMDGVTYTIGGPVSPGWANAQGGDYHLASNWIGGIPNAVDAVATFGDAIGQPRLVYANSSVTVGTINFNNANKYLLAGLGTLTLQVSSGTGLIDVQQGTHQINLPTVFASNSNINTASGTSLILSDPVTVNSGVQVTQSGSGNVVYQSTLKVLSGGSFELAAGSGATLQAASLDVAGGRLNVQDNRVVTNTAVGSSHNGKYDGVQGMVQSGYNYGAWDGNGIVTTQGQALAGLTTIAVGQTDAGTVAAYTYAGDLNFDGLVDAADYGVIDNWVQFPGTDGYANGDFNYDGVIDAGDYGIIDNTIQLQGAPISLGASGVSGVTAVPEPACGVALFALGALVTRSRRRAKS